MARGATGGVGDIAESGGTMMLFRLVLLRTIYLVFVWYLWRETPLA